MRLVLAFALLLISTVSLAFPENTRLGYSSCQSCHVSPTGGGVLTPYGRMIGNEITTWAEPGESNFAYTEKTSWEKVQVGGDFRYAATAVDTEELTAYRWFPMAYDVELAVHLGDKVILASTFGIYGPLHEREQRRNYLLYNHNENLSFRVGKFFPAYGLLIPDHTAVNRSGLGWGEGKESYNFETSLKSQLGEIFATVDFGDEGTVGLTEEDGYQHHTDEETAGIFRAALFLGKASQVGVSYYDGWVTDGGKHTVKLGTYGIIGFNKDLYWLYQLDQVRSTGLEKLVTLYSNVGYVFVKGASVGFRVQAEVEDEETEQVYGVGLQWLPRPHLEATFNVDYVLEGKEAATKAVLMLHYYL